MHSIQIFSIEKKVAHIRTMTNEIEMKKYQKLKYLYRYPNLLMRFFEQYL